MPMVIGCSLKYAPMSFFRYPKVWPSFIDRLLGFVVNRYWGETMFDVICDEFLVINIVGNHGMLFLLKCMVKNWNWAVDGQSLFSFGAKQDRLPSRFASFGQRHHL